MKLERIVKRFYDSLDNNIVEGRRCKECEAVEFPPVIACNHCGSTNMEWFEISGKGVMKDFFLPGMLTAQPQNKDLMPYCYGVVEIEGGAAFNTIICGVSQKNADELRQNLPAPVRVKVIQREEYRTVVFELV